MKAKKIWIASLPLIIFFALVLVFNRSLDTDPKVLGNNLIGKKVPDFKLNSLYNPEQLMTHSDLPDMPYLMNVWATWCGPCHIEHPYLMKFANQVHIPIVGINYKDKPKDALTFLEKGGNPYFLIVADTQGSLAIDLGVIGAPETFIVDASHVIRGHYIGVIDDQVWEKIILPQLKSINQEHRLKLERVQGIN